MENKILGWQHERTAKLTQARALLESAETEKRDLNADEEKRYADLVSAAESLDGKIDRERKLQALEADQDLPQRRAAKPVPQAPAIGMTDGEVRRYSLVNAINAFITGDWRNARMELEASEATAKRLGFSPQGFFIPYEFAYGENEKRDLTKGTNTAGGYTIATNLLAQNFIDLLRNRAVLMQSGMTVLSGLVGDIAIPRQTGAATAYWVAENGAPTESQPAFDQVPMSPKTVGAFVDMSRKLLKQSSIDVEAFVRRDLANVLGLEIDRAGLHGSGSSNQPTGVAATSGIGSVAGGTNGAAPTWANIVALETAVAVANADAGMTKYITNPKVRGKLKNTVIGTDQGMVWGVNATQVNGYDVAISNQVSSVLTKGTSSGVCSAIFFGNWADLFMGMWGGLDLLVDPYTNGTTGAVRVISLQDTDFAVRHPESFAAMLDALTT